MSDSTEIEPDLFRRVCGRYPTGVTIVTGLDADGEPTAMVVGTFVSVSLDPPLVGFLPAKSSSTWERMRHGGVFGVNVLADSQLDVSNTIFRKEVDPFEVMDWEVGRSGAARIAGCPAWIDCEIDQVVEAGDHYIVIGRVVELDCADASEPLLFLGGGYGSYRALDS